MLSVSCALSRHLSMTFGKVGNGLCKRAKHAFLLCSVVGIFPRQLPPLLDTKVIADGADNPSVAPVA
jgi:hypothetical protein